MIELVMISPWIFMLFIGALDWGFYSSALVSLQAGLRSAVLYTSSSVSRSSDTADACDILLNEIRKLPNIGAGVSTCGVNPIVVAEGPVVGPDAASASRVTVTYRSITLIPLPGLLARQFTVTRRAIMRIRA